LVSNPGTGTQKKKKRGRKKGAEKDKKGKKEIKGPMRPGDLLEKSPMLSESQVKGRGPEDKKLEKGEKGGVEW